MWCWCNYSDVSPEQRRGEVDYSDLLESEGEGVEHHADKRHEVHGEGGGLASEVNILRAVWNELTFWHFKRKAILFEYCFSFREAFKKRGVKGVRGGLTNVKLFFWRLPLYVSKLLKETKSLV